MIWWKITSNLNSCTCFFSLLYHLIVFDGHRLFCHYINMLVAFTSKSAVKNVAVRCDFVCLYWICVCVFDLRFVVIKCDSVFTYALWHIECYTYTLWFALLLESTNRFITIIFQQTALLYLLYASALFFFGNFWALTIFDTWKLVLSRYVSVVLLHLR